MRHHASSIYWIAISCWIAGLLGAIGAEAGEVVSLQNGLNGTAQIEQIASRATVHIAQSEASNRLQAIQNGAAGSMLDIEQRGQSNFVTAFQGQGQFDQIQVVQAGTSNFTLLQQFSMSGVASENLISIQQYGTRGAAVVAQVLSVGATALVYQSELASSAYANIHQFAQAPTAAIAQGVESTAAATADPRAQVSALRAGQASAAPDQRSTAVILQTGGAGLIAYVGQSYGAQLASITQNGSYLEATILQSGPHIATLLQSGNGIKDDPYRASLVQVGATPQNLSIQQLAGSSPRSLQVVQR